MLHRMRAGARAACASERSCATLPRCPRIPSRSTRCSRTCSRTRSGSRRPGGEVRRLGGAVAARACRCGWPTTGPGIPPEDRERVFEAFERGRMAGPDAAAAAGSGSRSRARSSSRTAAGSGSRGRPSGGTAVVFELPLRDAEPVAAGAGRTGRDEGARRRRRAADPPRDAHEPRRRTATRSRRSGPARRRSSRSPSSAPELVLLDLGLPDMDGTEVIRRVRSFSEVPIIVLSVRDRQADKVAALDAGADDYVTKPFGVEELLARLRAALRRSHAEEPSPPVLAFGDLRGGPRAAAGDAATASPSTSRRPSTRLLEALRHEPGQAPHPPVAAPARLGPGVRGGEPLPPRLRPLAAAQARRRGGRARS